MTLLLFLFLAPHIAALLKTLFKGKKKAEFEMIAQPVREEKYAKILAGLIASKTVSYKEEADLEAFEAFHEKLRFYFPLVFEQMTVHEFDGSLLLHWKGKKNDRPLMLMSHQDTVEAGEGWSVEPFGETIKDGKVWGRGAADTKCSLMAFYQACQELLEEGFVPEQDIYLASSNTEETAGDGAMKIRSWLEAHQVSPFMILDEGGGIIADPMPGISGLFAMTGMYEKGQGNVRFISEKSGGHASSPPRHSALTELSGFISDVSRHSGMKKQLDETTRAMFYSLAPFSNFAMRLAFSNLWLYEPLLIRLMPYISDKGAAMMATTVAFTQISGSSEPNVLPSEAWVNANLRFAPHQDAASSLAVLEKKAQKHQLKMEAGELRNATVPVETGSEAFLFLKDVIHQTWPGLEVVPYALMAATDCRFYEGISRANIRFAPILYHMEQLNSMHGIDENIEMISLPSAVDFYKNLIKAHI